ncbi:MAG: DoxX family protein [Bacteroidota bacterium]
MSTKTKNIIGWILSGLLALAFLGAGVTKLIGVEMQIENLTSWGYPLWFRFPIGLGEVSLAIGLLMPAYRKWVIYAIYAWGVVAIFTHIQATPPQYEQIGAPVIFLVLNTILYFVSKSK